MSHSFASSPQAEIYRFGPFEANPRTGKLHKRGIRISLEPRGFDVLLILLRSPGKSLRAEIIREIWHPIKDPAEFYDHLGQAIAKIRRALGDSAISPRYIETEPGVGYAFIAPVERIRIDDPSAELQVPYKPEETPELSEISYPGESRVDHFVPSVSSGVEPVSRETRRVKVSHLRPLDTLYGGEGRICAAISLSYGLMVGLALLMEVAYRWPEFSRWVVYASPCTGVASACLAGTIFKVMRGRVSANRFDSIPLAAGLLSLWTILLALAAAPWLPDESIVQANFQTLTARVGYPKSLIEALGLPILSLVPVQAVFVLRQRMFSDDISEARRVLRNRGSIPMLHGAVIPGPSFSLVAYAVVTLWWLSANAHLLENLKTGPYYALFVELAAVRAAAGLITFLVVLLWYLLRWNQLKDC